MGSSRALLDFMIEEDNYMDEVTRTLIKSGIIHVSRDVNVERPCRTLPFAGFQLITDLLSGNPDKGYHHFRMNNTMFFKLQELLVSRGLIVNTQHITAQQQLAYFLYCVGHGVPNRAMTETFQHLGENISQHFNNVLKAICSLTHEYIALPCQDVTVHPHIRSNHCFYPYFQNAIGGVDAINIPVIIKKSKQRRFRDWKGIISQKVMVAASFDHSFFFVSTGWEGSTNNMRVLQWCVEQGGFDVPEGKYYLVDKSYPNAEKFIAPYPRYQDHLSMYKYRRGRRCINSMEFFNYRHAQLRSCVSKTFNILRKRFRILHSPIPSPLRVQQRIILACCIIHNFIKRNQEDDKYFDMILQSEHIKSNADDTGSYSSSGDEIGSYWTIGYGTYLTRGDKESLRGKKLRNVISRTMWRDHRDLESDDEERVIQ